MQRPLDVIEILNQQLVMRFGLTGITQSMCVLNIGNYCRLYRDGVELRARFTDREDVIIEKFPTEALADNALRVASDAVRSQASGKPVERKRWKRWMPWVVAPALVLVALEAFYFYSGGVMPNVAQTAGDSQPVLMSSSDGPALIPMATGETRPAERAPIVAPDRLAQLLSDAVVKGSYSFEFSKHEDQDASKILYVFSDPNCIYCRRLDAHLKTLGQKYTVHLFPVSVVGEESSLRIGEDVLCSPQEERAAVWDRAMKGIVPPSDLQVDESCRLAVGDNDQVFRALQFRGTPTILDGFGQEVPEWIPHTAWALDEWMQSARVIVE